MWELVLWWGGRKGLEVPHPSSIIQGGENGWRRAAQKMAMRNATATEALICSLQSMGMWEAHLGFRVTEGVLMERDHPK